MTSPTQTQREAFESWWENEYKKVIEQAGILLIGRAMAQAKAIADDAWQAALAQATPQSPVPAETFSNPYGTVENLWKQLKRTEDLADAVTNEKAYLILDIAAAKTLEECHAVISGSPKPPAAGSALPEGLRERLKKIKADAGAITRRSNGDVLMLANRIIDTTETILATPPAKAEGLPEGLREALQAAIMHGGHDSQCERGMRISGDLCVCWKSKVSAAFKIIVAQPPALKALVEAARAMLLAWDKWQNVGTDIDSVDAFYEKADKSCELLRAALTPFLDPAQPKQEER